MAERLSQNAEMPEQIGRFRILCELGVGGMAAVYLGRAEGPKGFERLMAIKVVHPHFASQRSFVDMLFDEARIAARIHHPNVVPVYELGEDRGRYFIAMDYVDGETLSMVLSHTWRRGSRMPFEIASYIIAGACEALHAAHELTDHDGRPMSVVHRDVSPQNIMIGYDGVIRVMDFGVAKATDRLDHTQPGAFKGKYAYMAPEQMAVKAKTDRRVDIFALGTVLWETITGKRLFKGDSDLETLERVRRVRIPRPSKVRGDIPAALDAVVLRALERDVTKRYQTARELGSALREYLAADHPRLSAVEIEQFMKDVFPDRRERRLEMKKKAAGTNPSAVSRPGSDDILSLSNVGVFNNTGSEVPAMIDEEIDPVVTERPDLHFVPPVPHPLERTSAMPSAPLISDLMLAEQQVSSESAAFLSPEPAPRRRWPIAVGVGAIACAFAAGFWWTWETTGVEPAPVVEGTVTESTVTKSTATESPVEESPPVVAEEAEKEPLPVVEAAAVVEEPKVVRPSRARSKRAKAKTPASRSKEVLMGADDL